MIYLKILLFEFLVCCVNGALLVETIYSTLLSECHLSPRVNSPFEQDNSGQKANITISLEIDRFIDISDVDESYSFYGAVIIGWEVSCVAQQYAKNKASWPSKLTRENVNDYWAPKISHLNTLRGTTLDEQSGLMRQLIITLKTGSFTSTYQGMFESFCDLQLYYFPFDRQNCELMIILNDMNDYVNLESVNIMYKALSFMPRNANWLNVDNWPGNVPYVMQMDSGYSYQLSRAVFRFTFERRPVYYMINAFAPSFLLSTLELTSFLVPADMPDRPTFGCTVMLAVFVLQDQIFANLPKTPTRIAASDYLLAQTVYATICVIYAAAMCTFVNCFPDMASKKVVIAIKPFYKGTQLKLSTLIDYAAFGLAALVLGLINLVMVGIMLARPDN